ncbi:unnamed protein product [Nyctereutes procyonoides]|uniref:(raccoon dog) hypothetical protein n=1 Tax=Nyctereutes procyonoides TaxID=34880 RepID=A0A811YBL2_NYCPR|nr:unnamed protein product [Nyctereutes procyonoides]
MLVSKDCLVDRKYDLSSEDKDAAGREQLSGVFSKTETARLLEVTHYYGYHRTCKYSWDCAIGYECCFAICGSICLNIRQIGQSGWDLCHPLITKVDDSTDLAG